MLINSFINIARQVHKKSFSPLVLSDISSIFFCFIISAGFFFCLLFCTGSIAQELKERDLDDAPSGSQSSGGPAKSTQQPPPWAPGEKKPLEKTSPQSQPTYEPPEIPEPYTPHGEREKTDDGAFITSPRSKNEEPPSFSSEGMTQKGNVETEGFSESQISQEVHGFFAESTRSLAEALGKAFRDYGRPVGYIKGDDGGAAFILGVRYGSGYLHMYDGRKYEVFWQSPSLGVDIGLHGAKVFTLVYNLVNPEDLFQRFSMIDGSLYFFGGFSINYQRSGNIILAPIRLGAGIRMGISMGYTHYTRKKHFNPF